MAVGLAALSCQSDAVRAPSETAGEPAEAAASTAKPKHGILGRQAPAWRVDTWFNLEDGARAPDISIYRDKVVFLFFYQSW